MLLSRASSRLILSQREKYQLPMQPDAARAPNWSKVRPCGVRHEAEEQPGKGACGPRGVFRGAAGMDARGSDARARLQPADALPLSEDPERRRLPDVDPQLGLHAGAEDRRDGLSDASLRPAGAARRALPETADGCLFLHRHGLALVRQQDPLRGFRILRQKPDQFLSARPADAA